MRTSSNKVQDQQSSKCAFLYDQKNKLAKISKVKGHTKSSLISFLLIFKSIFKSSFEMMLQNLQLNYEDMVNKSKLNCRIK